MTKPDTNRVLANTTAILNTLAVEGPQLITEISVNTEIPRPTIYRIINSMQSLHLVNIARSGRVQLGARLLRLGHLAQLSIPEVQAAGSGLTNLRRQTGHTAYLCQLRDRRTICLDWRMGRNVGLPVLRPGMILPDHAGSATFVNLAFNRQYEGAVLESGSFPALTPYTLTSASELARAVQHVRERGFSLSDQDVTIGVAALGVPLFDRTGTFRGALSVAGLREVLLAGDDAVVESLQLAAKEIGSRFDPA